MTSFQGALIAWRLTFTTLGSNEGRQAMDPTTVLVSREVILAAGCGQAINDHLSCLLDTCSAASALMKVMMHRSSRKRVAVCMRDACRCVLAVPLAACSPPTGPLQARGICPRLASHVSAFFPSDHLCRHHPTPHFNSKFARSFTLEESAAGLVTPGIDDASSREHEDR